jgi:protein SCO1
MKKLYIVIGLLFVILIVGIFLMPKKPQLKVAKFVEPVKELPKFTLKQNDKIFDKRSLQGKWSFVFFGYARCPDVCPTELMFLNNVNNELRHLKEKNKNIKVQMPQVFFISVDAQRDTAEMLSQFTSYFNKDFKGIGGEQKQADKIADFFNVIYERVYHKDGKQIKLDTNKPVPADLKDSYLINHSADIYLVNPEGQYHAIFPLPHQLEDFTADLVKIVQDYE